MSDYIELQFEQTDDHIWVRINESTLGQPRGKLSPPFTPAEAIERLEEADSPEDEQADMGQQLYNALKEAEVADALRMAMSQARRTSEEIILQLRFDESAVGLAGLPWELLHDGRRHLLAAGAIDLTRYITYDEGVVPLRLESPLRVLHIGASPKGLSPLNIAASVEALKSVPDLQIESLPNATYDALLARLEREPRAHVLHFDGHGGIREGKSVLCFEKGESAEIDFVTAKDLCNALHNQVSLVVLNACQSSQLKDEMKTIFEGMAPALIETGIPAVVGMQFPIFDQSAIRFIGAFYNALMRKEPLTRAMTAARKWLYREGSWYIPTLYLRSDEPTGQLFAQDEDMNQDFAEQSAQRDAMERALLERLDEISQNMKPPEEDWEVIGQEYRNYLVSELKDHIIRGFAPQVDNSVLSLPLAKIFLPLQALEGRPALAEYADEDLRRQIASEFGNELDWQQRRVEIERRYTQLQARQTAQRSLSLADLLKNTRAVLLGDPGMGKTTVTEYITYALAADNIEHIGNSVRGMTPVLVRITNYGQAFEGDKTLHLIDYIEENLTSRPKFGRYLRREIEEGNCLVILDGLDEVADPALRRQVTDRIQEMVASYSDNCFMVTSRIVGYDLSPLTREFKHATLQELTQEDRERFIHLWYNEIQKATREVARTKGANDLIEALRDKPQIARLAANPLLLTIIVLMHWRGTKLPSRRVQVYENATDTLIEYWTQQRGVELDAVETKAILAPIAHYIISSNVAGVIAHSDLLPRFYRGIMEWHGCCEAESRKMGKELLKDLNEHSGLFLKRGLDQNNQSVYGFMHLTFGEYLAALQMVEEMQSG